MSAPYRVLGPIASGGMGEVSLAVKREGDGSLKALAVKKLHAHRAEDPDSVAMFVDEARIASRLVHPNVVRIRDVEMVQDELVILMDYVEGITLADLQRALRDQGKTLPVPVACRILHDALRGLDAAHNLKSEAGAPLGIVHRDVSPHNLLVGSDGVTRIADFGIAVASGRLSNTAEIHVKGKLRYLSPEQIYRKGVDLRTDIFAAGIVLWECLTGQKLFGAQTEGETLAMILREPIAPPSAHRFEVPLELDEACLKALERDRDRRYDSGAAFAEALEVVKMAAREEVSRIVEASVGEQFRGRRELLRAAEAKAMEPPPPPLAPAESASATPATTAAAARRRTEMLPTQKRRRVRDVLVASALLVGAVVGACGARLAETTRAEPAATRPVESARAAPLPSAAPEDSRQEATLVPSPSASHPIDLDLEPPSAPPTPRNAEAPKASRPRPKAPAGVSSSAKRGRPFMPSDL